MNRLLVLPTAALLLVGVAACSSSDQEPAAEDGSTTAPTAPTDVAPTAGDDPADGSEQTPSPTDPADDADDDTDDAAEEPTFDGAVYLSHRFVSTDPGYDAADYVGDVGTGIMARTALVGAAVMRDPDSSWVGFVYENQVPDLVPPAVVVGGPDSVDEFGCAAFEELGYSVAADTYVPELTDDGDVMPFFSVADWMPGVAESGLPVCWTEVTGHADLDHSSGQRLFHSFLGAFTADASSVPQNNISNPLDGDLLSRVEAAVQQ